MNLFQNILAYAFLGIVAGSIASLLVAVALAVWLDVIRSWRNRP